MPYAREDVFKHDHSNYDWDTAIVTIGNQVDVAMMRKWRRRRDTMRC